MTYTWSLDSLYKGYDKSYENDFNAMNETIKSLDTLAQNLENYKDVEKFLESYAKLSTLSGSLVSFASLQLSVNANDDQSNQMFGKLRASLSNTARPFALFNKFIAENKADFPTWLKESELIKEHEFMLQEIIDTSTYQLDEALEESISKMKLNASNTWENLQGDLTANTTIEFNGETHTMSSIRNFAYNSDPKLRKAAYEAELELYKKIDTSVAYALNSIKGEANTIAAMRGYEDVLQQTLIASRLERETLDALLAAMEESFPIFEKYFQHKAKLLGHENGLPWYDLFAPLETKESKTYTIEEAQQIILDSFYSFSDDLGDLAQRAFDEKWVDYLPREGKRSGAFCSNQAQIKESRIMTNFGGSISDVITLAHELGHAYHGYIIEDLSILNTGYSMPVAETASTFCENLVLNHTLKTASDDEKLILLENSISDLAQIIVDISSRFKFEHEVFTRRQSEFLSVETLNDIMIRAQKETYGAGLDQTVLHPYMWICKPHYYSAGLGYYNFPYAFGGLFALGLFGKFQEEGKTFVPKYQQLLLSTTTAMSEDVALVADINLRDKAFWESSLKIVEKRIDDFIKLTA